MALEVVLSVALLAGLIWAVRFLIPKAVREDDALALICAVATAVVALAAWLLIGVRVATLSMGTAAQPPTREPRLPANSAEWTAVGEALLEGGIPAAAGVYGLFTDVVPFGGITRGDLDAIASMSHAIVTGDAVAGVPRLTGDRRLIVTEYEVVLTRVLKGEGALEPGRSVVVSVPGGELRFADGSRATLSVEDGPPVEIGHSYLLFLESIDDPAIAREVGRIGTFRPANGAQGVNELLPAGRVKAVSQTGPLRDQLEAAASWEQALLLVSQAIARVDAHPQTKRLPRPW